MATETQLEQKNLPGFTPDSKLRVWGKKVHEDRTAYGLFGFIDGFSLSYSFLKYGFGFFKSNKLHQILTNPVGWLFAVTFSLIWSTFSAISNYCKDDDEDEYLILRWISIIEPYVRVVVKGLKRSYSGISSLFTAVSLISRLNLAVIIFPVGFTLGIASAYVSILYRRLIQQRKAQQDYNKNTTKSLIQGDLSLDNTISPQRQTLKKRALGFFAAICISGTESLYYYFGIIGVITVSLSFPPLLITLLGLCTIYSVCNVLTRINEEWIFQRRLEVTALNLEIVIHKLEIERLLAELELEPNNKDYLTKKTELLNHLTDFLHKQNKAHQYLQRSTFSALLVGVKNGLTCYSVFSIVIFAVPLITFMAPFLAIGLLPYAAVGVVLLGVVFIPAFALQSVVKNYLHNKKLQEQLLPQQQKNSLPSMVDLRASTLVFDQNKDLIKAVINDITFEPPPITLIPEKFELGRSAATGFIKLIKDTEFVFEPAERITILRNIGISLAIIGSFFGGAIIALRAYGRGFGRDPAELDVIIDKPIVPLSDSSTSRMNLQFSIHAVEIPSDVRDRIALTMSTDSAGDEVNTPLHIPNASQPVLVKIPQEPIPPLSDLHAYQSTSFSEPLAIFVQ